LTSNHLIGEFEIELFIETLLQHVSWSILRPILSIRVPSIQAFAESVLLYTITSPQIHIVKDLLSHAHIKASVVSNGSALLRAVHTSSCELVSLILHTGACPNKTTETWNELPLTEVSDVGVAELLLQAGADIHSEGMFYIEHEQVHGPGVIAATASRNIDLFRYLIGAGADVNQHGRFQRTSLKYTAVMAAVESGMGKILETLLQLGARPNDISAAGQIYYGYRAISPLQMAARRGDLEAVQLLIRYGGNVNASTCGDSALAAAVSRADIEMTKLLLRNGADVNAPGDSDVQLLTTAVEMNHLELVEAILDAGADVNILSHGNYGCTARECAICLLHGSDIRDLLVARGARWDTQVQTKHHQNQLRQAVLSADISRVMTILGTGLKVDMQPFRDDRHRSIYNFMDRAKSILQDAVVAGSAIFRYYLMSSRATMRT
jgi:ankyrin repeat protein